MIRRPPRSTLFPYTDALPISARLDLDPAELCALALGQRKFEYSVLHQGPDMLVVELTLPKGERAQLRSEEHTSELQSHLNLVCRLLLEKKNKTKRSTGMIQRT